MMEEYKFIVSFETNTVGKDEVQEIWNKLNENPYSTLDSYDLIDNNKIKLEIKRVDFKYIRENCHYFEDNINRFELICHHCKSSDNYCSEKSCPLQDR